MVKTSIISLIILGSIDLSVRSTWYSDQLIKGQNEQRDDGRLKKKFNGIVRTKVEVRQVGKDRTSDLGSIQRV